MTIGHDIATAVGQALHDVHAGDEKLALRKIAGATPATIEVTSDAFTHGAPLPRSATADGEGVPPTIRWSALPASARSVVVVCEDPDAPFPQPFAHWMVYGVPATAHEVTEYTVADFRQGMNTMLKNEFAPAAPPPGHGPHHYHFQVFALDVELPFEPGAGRSALLHAMKDHVVAWGELVGTYERN